MPVLNRPADRFQRALQGERVSDAQIEALVETSRHLVDLPVGPAPDPVFVATLRERLMAEAASRPAPSPAAARAAAARRAASRTTPVVVVLGRGAPRLIAGAAASALLVGGIVGAASRSAVPGQALYPVKSWLDGVQVRLADSDLDRGRVHLDQAQEHISDARKLADAHADPREVNVALAAAIESVRDGQRSLDKAYAETGSPQALLAMRDFSARALPQLDALRGEVRAESLPFVAQLEALLQQAREANARRIAACGARCSELASTVGPASIPTTLPTGPSQSPTARATSGGSAAPSSSGDVSVPSAPVTAPAGGSLPAPSVSVDGGGLGGAGVGGGGVTAGSGGASVGLPTVSASVPLLPGVTVTLPLPSATVGTGGVGATVPGQTLGPVTLPGVTLTLP